MTPLPIIAPSWVIPGSPAANAAFLCGRVRGIMLCCFEHAPRLPMELPATSLGLDWHIHLPVDLPWKQGGEAAGRAACRTMADAMHLLGTHSRAILHRPPHCFLLADFLHVWHSAGYAGQTLILENTPGSDVDEDCAASRYGLRLCLDAAHLVLSCPVDAAVQYAAARAPLVDMVHWSAPRKSKDTHAPLTELDADRKNLYRYIAESIPSALDVIEVFDWDGVLASWGLLQSWRMQPRGWDVGSEQPEDTAASATDAGPV